MVSYKDMIGQQKVAIQQQNENIDTRMNAMQQEMVNMKQANEQSTNKILEAITNSKNNDDQPNESHKRRAVADPMMSPNQQYPPLPIPAYYYHQPVTNYPPQYPPVQHPVLRHPQEQLNSITTNLYNSPQRPAINQVQPTRNDGIGVEGENIRQFE